MKKALSILSALSGITLLIYLYKLFSSAPLSSPPAFPKEAEKAAAEKEVQVLKEEVKAVEGKTYSDEDIEKKFN